MKALVTTILLGMTALDTQRLDAELDPPQREPGKAADP